MKKVNSMDFIKAVRYPTEEQSKVWAQRRIGIQPSDIADSMSVSRPYVSQAQRIAEERIENLMKHTSQVLRIDLRHINTEVGFAVGMCFALDTVVYLTYSPVMGIQTWYHHRGNCLECDKIDECNAILANLSKEWGVLLSDEASPSAKGIQLFDEIMERLGWTIGK